MMMLHSLFVVFLFSLLRVVIGDVTVVTPEGGTSFSGSSGTVSIKLEWVDNGATPKVPDISKYTFTLEYGPNTHIDAVAPLAKLIDASKISFDGQYYSYTVTFPSTTCGNGQFYIQIYSVVNNKGTTINYSPRFTLTGMSGTATTYTYTDTLQPVGQTDINAGTTTTASIDTRSFTVPYTEQTGISRFAPMQMQPATKITATTWTRKFAKSSVTYYSVFRTSLDQMTTITPGWSYTLPSGINRATPAPYPSQNGGSYDPKKRQSLSTRKVNLQNRLSSAEAAKSSSGSSSESSSSSDSSTSSSS